MDYTAQLRLHIGTRIRLRRRTIYLTPHELAEKAKISITELRAYERGNLTCNFHRLMRIAEALEVEVFYFYAEMSPDLLKEFNRRLNVTSESV